MLKSRNNKSLTNGYIVINIKKTVKLLLMKEKNKAWLIDSSIYVFKSWYTYPECEDMDGHSINAVMGFTDFVFRLLSNEKPELIAFAFDESLTTSHRRDIYPEYKANRSPAPESLRYQFRLCRAFIESLGIYQSASNSYEADDLIGTWAKYLNQSSIPVNIITADKDLAQLVCEGDHWWEYARGEMLDVKKITKRFKAKPSQIADQLAIAGDKADNIPGVPGLGMSTAGKLLRKFENIDQLFLRVDEIQTMQIRGAKRIQDLIVEHEDSIRLSKRLTKICCDIEPVTFEQFGFGDVDIKTFGGIAEQLQFSDERFEKWLQLLKTLRG